MEISYSLLFRGHVSFRSTKNFKIAFVIFSTNDMAETEVTYFRNHVLPFDLTLAHQNIF
jgi:hypothetical protein